MRPSVPLAAALACAGCGGAVHASSEPAAGPARSAGTLVYSKELADGFELFTSRADGTGERRITHLPGAAEQPDWSPDGRRIVFQYDRPREKGCSIALVDADGGGLTDLGRAARTCDSQPAFFPDGEHIVYTHYDDRAETERIAIMDADGGHRREIRTTPWRFGPVDANVSPDGRWITFVHLKQEEALQALYRMRRDGSHLRRLTPYRWEIAVKHDWSPDGRLIAVTRQRDVSGGEPDALLLRPNGKLVRRVARSAYVGGFSPDGSRLVLRLERNAGAEGRLAVVDPDGTGLRALTPWTGLRPRFIDWGAG